MKFLFSKIFLLLVKGLHNHKSLGNEMKENKKEREWFDFDSNDEINILKIILTKN